MSRMNEAVLPSQASSLPEQAHINAEFLCEMIVSDLNTTALQIGLLCMKTTACVAPGSRFSLHALRHVAGDNASVVRLVLRYGASAGFGVALRAKLDKFYSDFSVMQTHIGPLAAAVELTAPALDKLSRLLPSLRKLALAASEALVEVAPVARARLNADYVRDGELLREFLQRAANGDTSAVDRFGVITPPQLAQRRQSPRANLSRPCRLIFASGEAEARISDVSRYGVGVTCRAPLAEGQELEIVVDNRRIPASVRRRDGARIGLALKTPLAITDPLFRT